VIRIANRSDIIVRSGGWSTFSVEGFDGVVPLGTSGVADGSSGWGADGGEPLAGDEVFEDLSCSAFGDVEDVFDVGACERGGGVGVADDVEGELVGGSSLPDGSVGCEERLASGC
jgi:hypothetical protein